MEKKKCKAQVWDEKQNRGLFLGHSVTVIINESDIDDVLQSVYTTIITNIQKFLGKGLHWTCDSVIDHTVSISKYNSLAGSSYIKLPNCQKKPSNNCKS